MSALVRRTFSHLRLRVVITAAIVSLLFVTAAVTWYLTFRNGQIAIGEIADHMGRQGMSNIQQHLEGYFSVPIMINKINLFAFSLSDPREIAKGRLQQRFQAEIKQFESVVSVAYANESREYIGVSRGIEGVPLETGVIGAQTGYHLEAYELSPEGRRGQLFDRSGTPVDPRARPWYTSAVKAGATTWTPVYAWLSGDVGIDAVTPVYVGGALTGVLDTSLTISEVGNFLSGIRVTPHCESFIMDRLGMLVAASTVTLPYARSGGRLVRLLASESTDPVVRAGARRIVRELGTGDGIDAEREFRLRIGQSRHVMHVASFRPGPGVDWLVAEVIPESDFAQHIYDDMRSTALFVAAFLLLSALLALFLTRRVTAPLELLNSMARSLASGDLSQRISLQGTDEVGQLAASFNVMAEELRRSFASLVESESRYRTFVATSAAGIFRFEATSPMPLALSEDEQIDWFYRSFVMAECNDAAAGMLGCATKEMLLGGSPETWLPRGDPASLSFLRDMIGTSFQTTNTEWARPNESGRMRWYLASAGGTVESGRVVRVWGVLRDISDRRDAEEALRESELRYKAIFHRSAVSLWETDISELHRELASLEAGGREGAAEYFKGHPERVAGMLRTIKVVDVNETTVRLFEAKSREELLGPLDATFDPRTLAGFVPQAIARAEKGKQHDVETTVTTRTGKLLNVIMHFHVPAEDDWFSNMLVSVVDITKRTQAEQERARLEEQLRHAQKMETIGRLAGGISHDINNLLTPVLGYSELLVADEAPVRQEAASVILSSARRIRELTSKLLAFSRKQRLAKSVTDLRDVVADFQLLLRRTIRGNVEIRVQAPRVLGLVEVDVGQIEQVLMNLAINAQDAMPEGGTLTFQLRDGILEDAGTGRHRSVPAGDYVALTVSDTGTGMDEATRKRIFEPFFTTKETGKGTGLGLSTVYGIVKQHGGHIEVDSEPGSGTTFTIYFPRRGMV